jgi:hypothetical protein
METSYICLKWGTLKGWKPVSEKEKELLKKYFDLGATIGAAQQNDTAEQKEIICQLIDECNHPQGIYLDWDGMYVDKEEAKQYIMNYGKQKSER